MDFRARAALSSEPVRSDDVAEVLTIATGRWTERRRWRRYRGGSGRRGSCNLEGYGTIRARTKYIAPRGRYVARLRPSTSSRPAIARHDLPRDNRFGGVGVVCSATVAPRTAGIVGYSVSATRPRRGRRRRRCRRPAGQVWAGEVTDKRAWQGDRSGQVTDVPRGTARSRAGAMTASVLWSRCSRGPAPPTEGSRAGSFRTPAQRAPSRTGPQDLVSPARRCRS